LVTPIQVNILTQRSARCLLPSCVLYALHVWRILSDSHNLTRLYPYSIVALFSVLIANYGVRTELLRVAIASWLLADRYSLTLSDMAQSCVATWWMLVEPCIQVDQNAPLL